MYIKYYSITKLLGSILNPALSFLLISKIGTEQFGELSAYQLIFGFSSILLTMGIKNTYLHTELNEKSITENFLLKTIFFGSLIIGVGCTGIIYYGKSNEINISLLFIFYLGSTIPPIYELICSAMQSKNDFKSLTIFEVSYLLFGIIGYSIALTNSNSLSLIATSISCTCSIPIAYHAIKTLSPRNKKQHHPTSTQSKIFKIHFKYWKTSALEASYRNLDSLIISGGGFSNEAIGSFNIAKKLLALSYQPVNIYLHNICIANYFSLSNRKIITEKFHKRNVTFCCIYGATVFATAFILNNINFFNLIHLPQFTPSLILFTTLSMIAPFYFINTANSLALTAMKLVKEKNIAYIAAIISLSFIYALVASTKIINIAYSIIISEILLLIYLFFASRKYIY